MVRNRTRLMLLATTAIILTAVSGCERTEAIAHYKVPKPLPIDAPSQGDVKEPQQPPGEPKDRMLGAIVPQDSQAWFFKLTGPKDAVAAKEGEFMAFLKSVHFGDDGKPQWTLPDGWHERPESGIRFATLVIGDDTAPKKPPEVSVTVLPKSGDNENYALVNINRWREQLKLPPITKEQLPDESTQIELAGARATVVNLLGTASAAGMGGGPFSRGAGDGN